MSTQYTILMLSVLLFCSVCAQIVTHLKLRKILKQDYMANFTDLQNSINALGAVSTKLQGDVTNYVTLHSNDITSAQADTLAASINEVAATLGQISTSVTSISAE